jgi:hypothetical protein
MTATELANNIDKERLAKLKTLGTLQKKAASKAANQNQKQPNQVISISPKPPKPVKHVPVRTK